MFIPPIARHTLEKIINNYLANENHLIHIQLNISPNLLSKPISVILEPSLTIYEIIDAEIFEKVAKTSGMTLESESYDIEMHDYELNNPTIGEITIKDVRNLCN